MSRPTELTTRFGAVAVLAMAVGLAACSSTGQASSSPVATGRVDMPRSYRFSPADITVPAGTMVTWTNGDQFTHSVRLADGGTDLVVRPGESTTYVFTSPGLYRYTCTFHSKDMNGSVLVTDAR